MHLRKLPFLEPLQQRPTQHPGNAVEGVRVISVAATVVKAQQSDAEQPFDLDQPISGDGRFRSAVFATLKQFHLLPRVQCLHPPKTHCHHLDELFTQLRPALVTHFLRHFTEFLRQHG